MTGAVLSDGYDQDTLQALASLQDSLQSLASLAEWGAKRLEDGYDFDPDEVALWINYCRYACKHRSCAPEDAARFQTAIARIEKVTDIRVH